MAYIGRDIQYGTLDKQSFTANSSTTAFTLDTAVKDAKSLLVVVGGVVQEPEAAYTASATTLTFSEAPATNNAVYVIYLGKELSVGAERETITYQTGTGNNSTTPLTLSAAPYDASAIMVMLNGVTQRPVTDYTVSGTTLTFTSTVATGVNILVYHLGSQSAIGTINNNAVTDAKIVTMDASKLTGTLPASMAVDTTKIDQSIATLGLHIGVSDNKVSYNLPTAFIDTFESDSGILTETDVDRDTSGEYVSSIIVSQAQVAQGTGTAIGDLVDRGGLAAAFDSDNDENHSNSAGCNATKTVGYIGKDWGNGVTKTISGIKIWPANGTTSSVAWSSSGVGNATIDLELQGSTDNFASSVVALGTIATGIANQSTTGIETMSGFTTATAYRYHRVKLTCSAGSFEPTVAELEFYEGTTTASATGTLISTASTADAAVSKTSGIMLYEDDEGTGTLGTDLKVYFSSNDGTNWTEAASYGAATTFIGSTKMVKLGKTTISNTGTAVKMKAEWANQVAGQAGASAWATGNRNIGVTGSNAVVSGNFLNWVDGDTTTNAANRAWYWDGAAVAGRWIKFDFDGIDGGSGATRCIIGLRYYHTAAAASGIWQWQGSTDNSNWVNIGSTWEKTNGPNTDGVTTVTAMSANTTSYRYYRMLGVSGTYTTPWEREIEFLEATSFAVAGKVQRLHGWAVNY